MSLFSGFVEFKLVPLISLSSLALVSPMMLQCLQANQDSCSWLLHWRWEVGSIWEIPELRQFEWCYVHTHSWEKYCGFAPKLDVNPVFIKLNFMEFLHGSMHQRVCRTSRKKRTSKHGISDGEVIYFWQIYGAAFIAKFKIVLSIHGCNVLCKPNDCTQLYAFVS